MMKWLVSLLLAVVVLPGWAEPLYEFGFNVCARMRMDSQRNADMLLYSPFGEYSHVHLALYTESRVSLYFAQKLQNFDRMVDPDYIEQAYVDYRTNGWRVRVGKLWMPFGKALGEKELAKGIAITAPIRQGSTLELAVANNGRKRQEGVFCRYGSRVLGISVAAGEQLGISKTAFHFVRGEDFQAPLGAGYGLLVGLDTSQIAGVTLWQFEMVAALNSRHQLTPNTVFFIAKTSIRLPAGLSPEVRTEVDTHARDIRWAVSVQQNIGGGLLLRPLVSFRRADFEQASVELRANF